MVPGARVGVIGWKPYTDPTWLDAPSYLVDQIRALVGPGGSVVNVADMLIDPAHGLRTTNEADQIAAFEYASCQTSDGVRRLLFGLRPGMTEQEAVRLLGWNGAPLSCHLMLTAGPRATLGLLSPSDRPIELGDRFTTAFGIWGALTCRAGFVTEDAAGLPAGIGDYVERLVGPYFEAVAEWYQALRIGLPGGALQEIIDRRLGDPFFGIFLNPGHLLHLDEWISSPVSRGSQVPLRSGMVFQVDIIPATGTDVLHQQHRGRRRARGRERCATSSRRGIPRHGSASGYAAGSCASRWASRSSRRCCRCPTSRRTCRRSCSVPTT